ncbi:HTH-type transcriptional regulator NsrR [Candidatus Filomicrobium marinum]|uniref:HTH-type transcriptional regulator NsrR n=2 Tax=Filomicrobium TaxID=119044 RepID=A0A0D6JJW6_9HYPH|nr:MULTISPECIES: Rrf2 family transcriptional regulator [Filomicrobium]MCV0370866.1 Rrf2 family transcriptional regulator [Filomicrobium sp.]CFX32295.1 HTH-type transcriptional regulator NsrR [Candidatus Filomicrobium marinum]CPR21977.1 HTH-type transcriptional regulator NsrR [Candidatus Filomicrobium marinum]SDP47235.1 transcriptional regulator, BadM/Rrf2 family [Filomicrobium insigne]
MRLTMYTDYGLQTLTRLAAEPERVFSIDEIAKEFAASRNHLVKVIRDLAQCGVLEAQHGSTARGFRLARDPKMITLGEIVRLLESRKATLECLRAEEATCPPSERCRLSKKLNAAREAFLRELDTTTLFDCALVPRNRTQDKHTAETRHGATSDCV